MWRKEKGERRKEGGRKKVPLSLRVGKKGKGGRNGTGRITVIHARGEEKRREKAKKEGKGLRV